MKKYKFINIVQRNDEEFEDKPVYRVFNNKELDQIAIISYYRPWGKYVFTSKEGIVFDVLCLTDILDFMKNEIPK